MPASSQGVVTVKGYRELVRAFARADRAEKKEMRDALKDVADPIRRDSEDLARVRIQHIGSRWPLMRVGLTTSVVYVAPRERGRRSRVNRALGRPNLADLLMDRAMQPALDRNELDVADRFDEALSHIERTWGAG